jgi:pyruvate-formate lyase-activating enzyme
MHPSVALSIGFIVPYGEPSPGFFPDTLLAELCSYAREAGHRARVVHVYYDGRDAGRDAEVRRRLEVWLRDAEADLVVVERLFDPAPVRAHVAAAPHRRAILVTRGDSFDPVEGVDLVVGATPGMTRSGATRRTPAVAELCTAFARLLEAIAVGADPLAVPGVASASGGSATPIERAAPRRPYRAVPEHDVIALGPAPRLVRKTLFGNVGCPFAADPRDNPHYRGLALHEGPSLAGLGCGFCAMGGDYEKRPDAEVVSHLVEQAAFWTSASPEVGELVLSDQYALRYLAALVRAAAAGGVPPVRWLFAARPDTFVRERWRAEQAILAAEECGHVVELYLSGFEAFSDAELARYNKGATARDLTAAIAAMRELAASHPRAFAYAAARGHSLLLWSPWTSPEDLAESAATMREHGARELFHELAKNRLRLYRDLPIYYAAERDGALTDAWEDGDEGAGRRKGYSVEHPWRFLDPRTGVAHELAVLLRDRLGVEGELAQLTAAADFAGRLDAARLDARATVAAVARGLEVLVAALDRLYSSGARPSGAPARGTGSRAAVALFAGACNNHCRACANRDTWLDDRAESVLERVHAARALDPSAAIVLAGREPTIHPAFAVALAAARGPDGRRASVVTNGRRFAYAAFARAAVRAGLTGASVKLFAPDAVVADAITESDGAHEQALAGVRALRAAGLADLEIRAPLHASALAEAARFAPLARAAGVRQIRVECALDAVGLDRLEEAADAVVRLAEACARAGVALEASPLSVGTRLFDWYPGLDGGRRQTPGASEALARPRVPA